MFSELVNCNKKAPLQDNIQGVGFSAVSYDFWCVESELEDSKQNFFLPFHFLLQIYAFDGKSKRHYEIQNLLHISFTFLGSRANK